MLPVGSMFPHFARRPIAGPPVDTATAILRGPLWIVALRHAGSALTRACAAELDDEIDRLDAIGVGVIALVEGSLVEARDLVPRLRLRYPVVHDRDGSLYASLGVEHDRRLARTALDPRAAARWLTALARHGHGAVGAPLDRRIAAWVIDRDGRVAWAWSGRAITDRPPFATMPT